MKSQKHSSVSKDFYFIYPTVSSITNYNYKAIKNKSKISIAESENEKENKFSCNSSIVNQNSTDALKNWKTKEEIEQKDENT